MKVKVRIKNNGWYSTDNHWPKDGETVLVFNKDTGYDMMTCYNSAFWRNGCSAYVKYWMYLPKPPKEN